MHRKLSVYKRAAVSRAFAVMMSAQRNNDLYDCLQSSNTN